MTDQSKASSLASVLWKARTAPLKLAVKGYQKAIAPVLPRGHCRFYPSCSHYAIDALNEHGVVKGSCAAAWRVLRCNPFGGKGFDPACDFAWPWQFEKRGNVREQRAKDQRSMDEIEKATATEASCSPTSDHRQTPSEAHSLQA